MTKLIAVCSTLIFALTLTACSNKQAPIKKYYRLSDVTEVSATSVKPLTLVITRPKALSILGGRPMVATKEDGSLVQLSHNFWLESPKVLVQDKLKNWASAQWQKVSYQRPNDDQHQVLETRILAFEKRQHKAAVSLEFTLYNHDNSLLYSQRINIEKVIAGEGFKAFSVAINDALDSILNDLQTAL